MRMTGDSSSGLSSLSESELSSTKSSSSLSFFFFFGMGILTRNGCLFGWGVGTGSVDGFGVNDGLIGTFD